MSQRKKKKAPQTGRKQISKSKDIINRLFRNPNAVIGLIVVVIIVFVAAFANALVDYETQVVKVDYRNRLLSPSREHILGTDALGRDVLARIIYATRMSTLIGILSVFFGLGVGVILGAISGYFGGKIDMLMMRFSEAIMAIPSFYLLIILLNLL